MSKKKAASPPEPPMPAGRSGYALPKPPDRPEDWECCNRGCCPCIFDYYDDAMERWKGVVRRLGGDPDALLKSLGRT